jgi:Flp pilus assembly protein TadG
LKTRFRWGSDLLVSAVKAALANPVGKFIADDAGTSMVELTIASAVFVSILLGILEFGFATWARNSVVSDAREGARYAMVHGAESGRIADSATIADYVKSRTSLDSTIVVLSSWPDGTKDPGKRVSVKVRHAVPRRGPFLRAHTDSSTSTMVIVY